MTFAEEFELEKTQFAEQVAQQVGRSNSGQQVRIGDGSDLAGQVGRVVMIYYDWQHTGSSPDMLYIQLADGRQVRRLSTEVESLP